MVQKIDTELELDIGKDDTVELNVTASEPNDKNLVLKSETENKGIDQIPLACRDEEDVEVNIIGNSGFKGVEENCVDLTETESSSYSSFGDTGSGLDAASDSASSDSDEVESSVCDERRNPLSRLRKKKVTDHWREFIFPIMWRCKWIKLKLRKLNSQAKKYEKAIAAYDQQKQLDLSKFSVDDYGVKSIPRSEGMQRNNVMRRKKRKRVEECNSSKYMSNHSLFSYYENKNRHQDAPVEDFCDAVAKGNADIADNIGAVNLNDMWSSLDQHKDSDKSFFEFIEKVDEMLLQVENLKTRIDTVMDENPGKFCSVTQLSIAGPSNGLKHSVHNSSSFSGQENPAPGSFIHASSQHNPESNAAEDLLLTDNALSTRETITPFNETANRTQFEVPEENTKNELHDLENVMIQLEEKSKETVEEEKSNSPANVSNSDMVAENGVPNARSTKACSTSKSRFPRNTRRVRKTSDP